MTLLSAVGAHSIQGERHQENEDSFLIAQGDDAVLLMICDGVSSSPLGGWAARTCTSQMEYVFSKNHRMTFEEFKECLLDVDFELRGQGRGQAACTISALYIDRDSAWVASLGDSPAVCVSPTAVQRLIEHEEYY